VTVDDQGWVYVRKYEPRSDMSCVKFKAYDKRVKGMNYLDMNGASILVTISTEGYISVWSLDSLIDQFEKLDHKLMDLGDEFESIYHFEINSRLIAVGSRLNFVYKKNEPIEENKEDENIGVAKPLQKRSKVARFGKLFKAQNKLLKLRKFKYMA
jgi:hypothetical protein